MKIAKKKKRTNMPNAAEQSRIMNASWMVVAATAIQLGAESGYREKRIRKLRIGYWAGMEEMHKINKNRILCGGTGLSESDALEMAQKFTSVDLKKSSATGWRPISTCVGRTISQ